MERGGGGRGLAIPEDDGEGAEFIFVAVRGCVELAVWP